MFTDLSFIVIDTEYYFRLNCLEKKYYNLLNIASQKLLDKFRLIKCCSEERETNIFGSSWLNVSRKLSQALLLVDSFNFNLVDDERSDICLKEM